MPLLLPMNASKDHADFSALLILDASTLYRWKNAVVSSQLEYAAAAFDQTVDEEIGIWSAHLVRVDPRHVPPASEATAMV